MKYVLKNQEMQDTDYETIHQIGIPGLVLMERASKAVADCAMRHVRENGRILVIAGIGNNGETRWRQPGFSWKKITGQIIWSWGIWKKHLKI